MRTRVAAALAAVVLLAGCNDADTSAGAPEPSPSIRTLTPIALPPPPPPTGKLRADMRQSSRDAAAGRMEVWIDNDTAHQIRPRRIVYSDPRFRTPLRGTRLRPIPSQSERGFPIYLPPRPACDQASGRGRVQVVLGGRPMVVRVQDPTDVAGRYASSRCLELAIAKVADLRWSDAVPWDGQEGSDSTLTLVVTPTGAAGPALTLDTVSGTPVLSPVGTDVWRPDVTVHGKDGPQRIELPLKPTRCDAHAFAESGGATAFIVGLHLGGRPGRITLRMSTEGAANALAYAKSSCGDLREVTE
ncbi:hypothetical protein [Nocardioides aquiterrae]|uniref:Uncharacterized protein n=1 Tax=Nocardioides aquiterrae TaxID=203799 RepID=A0ABP4EUF9_9ACTN